jgi:hypothetical protein
MNQELARSAVPLEFDPVDQLIVIAKQFLNQAMVEQRKVDAEGRPTGNMGVFNEALLNAAKMCEKIAPYLRPRLGSVDHKFPQLDPSKMTDAQLCTLDGIIAALAVPGSDPGGDGPTQH